MTEEKNGWTDQKNQVRGEKKEDESLWKVSTVFKFAYGITVKTIWG